MQPCALNRALAADSSGFGQLGLNGLLQRRSVYGKYKGLEQSYRKNFAVGYVSAVVKDKTDQDRPQVQVRL